MNFGDIGMNLLKRLVENPQVYQPNKTEVIKVKSVQSFRGVFRTQSKILAFVY